jgi:DNA repair exonuclease SbcCD nuclease subunit
LHTADWQIGMKCSAAGERADDARRERLEAVKRIVDVANQRELDFMLVAGDVFDSRTPGASDTAVVVAQLKRVRVNKLLSLSIQGSRTSISCAT